MTAIVPQKEGRPTKYNDSLVFKVDEYLSECKSSEQLATKEGLSDYLQVDEDTLNNWANARKKDEKGNETEELLHPEFFGALKKVMSFQRKQLMTDGFYKGKSVNANMGIFLLKVNHGMIPNETKIQINANEAKVLVVPPELIKKYDLSSNTESGGPEQGKIQGS